MKLFNRFIEIVIHSLQRFNKYYLCYRYVMMERFPGLCPPLSTTGVGSAAPVGMLFAEGEMIFRATPNDFSRTLLYHCITSANT